MNTPNRRALDRAFEAVPFRVNGESFVRTGAVTVGPMTNSDAWTLTARHNESLTDATFAARQRAMEEVK